MARHTTRTDYRTLLRHAGLPEDEVERIASQTERDDEEAEKAKHMERKMREADEDADLMKDKELEASLAKIVKVNGLELMGNHPFFVDRNTMFVNVSDEGSGVPLEKLNDFAHDLESSGIGSSLWITGSDNGFLTISFKLEN